MIWLNDCGECTKCSFLSLVKPCAWMYILQQAYWDWQWCLETHCFKHVIFLFHFCFLISSLFFCPLLTFFLLLSDSVLFALPLPTGKWSQRNCGRIGHSHGDQWRFMLLSPCFLPVTFKRFIIIPSCIRLYKYTFEAQHLKDKLVERRTSCTCSFSHDACACVFIFINDNIVYTCADCVFALSPRPAVWQIRPRPFTVGPP